MYGKGSCRQWSVREDWLLPQLIAKLKVSLRDLVTEAPKELVQPPRKIDRKRIERDKARLNQRIAVAVERVMEPETSRETRQDINKRLDEMRDELRRLDAKLAAPEPNGLTNEQLEALLQFWDEFNKTAMSLPVSADEDLARHGGPDGILLDGTVIAHDPDDSSAVLIDPMRPRPSIVEGNRDRDAGGRQESRAGGRQDPGPGFRRRTNAITPLSPGRGIQAGHASPPSRSTSTARWRSRPRNYMPGTSSFSTTKRWPCRNRASLPKSWTR
jgi:hypothetical protein